MGCIQLALLPELWSGRMLGPYTAVGEPTCRDLGDLGVILPDARGPAPPTDAQPRNTILRIVAGEQRICQKLDMTLQVDSIGESCIGT